MNAIITNAKATTMFVANKAFAFLVLGLLMLAYMAIPPVSFDTVTGAKSGGMPFADVLYAVIMVVATITVAPIIRLLFFPEVAKFAEGDGLTTALTVGKFTPWLIHYFFATAISFAVTLLCLSSLTR